MPELQEEAFCHLYGCLTHRYPVVRVQASELVYMWVQERCVQGTNDVEETLLCTDWYAEAHCTANTQGRRTRRVCFTRCLRRPGHSSATGRGDGSSGASGVKERVKRRLGLFVFLLDLFKRAFKLFKRFSFTQFGHTVGVLAVAIVLNRFTTVPDLGHAHSRRGTLEEVTKSRELFQLLRRQRSVHLLKCTLGLFKVVPHEALAEFTVVLLVHLEQLLENVNVDDVLR